jgi:phage tail protein X
MTYVEYITQDRDRWDLIAWNHYGDPYQFERIIKANPTVPITPELQGGIRLAIPVIDAPLLAGAEQLPPWKRP